MPASNLSGQSEIMLAYLLLSINESIQYQPSCVHWSSRATNVSSTLPYGTAFHNFQVTAFVHSPNMAHNQTYPYPMHTLSATHACDNSNPSLETVRRPGSHRWGRTLTSLPNATSTASTNAPEYPMTLLEDGREQHPATESSTATTRRPWGFFPWFGRSVGADTTEDSSSTSDAPVEQASTNPAALSPSPTATIAPETQLGEACPRRWHRSTSRRAAEQRCAEFGTYLRRQTFMSRMMTFVGILIFGMVLILGVPVLCVILTTAISFRS
ncbi:hypothetical protein P152DRAFT_265912 [Eremomyces bilateralis CBS 781.70]|uniref:Uncharacterized protein n=1 Tax=Eremomyces bilateralis CBS 781.70 TaxID=1392243 RepID=A0A6G1G8F8_9PEZI|nr:uncharacterized protein P152DRAFT_265912 [Eremomyces bilateralis CBS 781.70]KAF1814272.1 hypothetical protein P152DRAFT_265912 [Eremomyces bilateralis CBS 781.70]